MPIVRLLRNCWNMNFPSERWVHDPVLFLSFCWRSMPSKTGPSTGATTITTAALTSQCLWGWACLSTPSHLPTSLLPIQLRKSYWYPSQRPAEVKISECSLNWDSSQVDLAKASLMDWPCHGTWKVASLPDVMNELTWRSGAWMAFDGWWAGLSYVHSWLYLTSWMHEKYLR